MRSIKDLSSTLTEALTQTPMLEIHGRVKRVVGTMITASVPSACVGC